RTGRRRDHHPGEDRTGHPSRREGAEVPWEADRRWGAVRTGRGDRVGRGRGCSRVVDSWRSWLSAAEAGCGPLAHGGGAALDLGPRVRPRAAAVGIYCSDADEQMSVPDALDLEWGHGTTAHRSPHRLSRHPGTPGGGPGGGP